MLYRLVTSHEKKDGNGGGRWVWKRCVSFTLFWVVVALLLLGFRYAWPPSTVARLQSVEEDILGVPKPPAIAAPAHARSWTSSSRVFTFEQVQLKPYVVHLKNQVELLFQIPSTPPNDAAVEAIGSTAKYRGVILVLHGCSHSARDFWDKDATVCPNCVGLPEETQVVRSALSRRYIVVAVTSEDRATGCWSPDADVERIQNALKFLKQTPQFQSVSEANRKSLFADGEAAVDAKDPFVPFFAFGISSGGLLLSASEEEGNPIHPFQAVVSQVAGTSPSKPKVPTMYQHMEKDTRTAQAVKDAVNIFTIAKIPIAAIPIKAQPITPLWFSDRTRRRIPPEVSEKMHEALKGEGLIDTHGFLKDDPRMSNWRDILAKRVPKLAQLDPLQADGSPVAELMNLAFAQHEISSDHVTEAIDWFDRFGCRWWMQKAKTAGRLSGEAEKACDQLAAEVATSG